MVCSTVIQRFQPLIFLVAVGCAVIAFADDTVRSKVVPVATRANQPVAEEESPRLESPSVPQWAHRAIFYQIFPERFENGDPSNDPTRESLESPSRVPNSWTPTPWTDEWYRRQPWELEMGENFFRHGVTDRRYGGDLQGILNRLDYLEKLGVTALYLNPIFYARSHHKYDGCSLHHVDPYFGPDPQGDLRLIEAETADPTTWQWTAADRLFLKLISEVHRRDMRLVLDGVFNHTGRDFFAFADIRQRQANSRFKSWYKIDSFDDPATSSHEFRYHGWWGHHTLPEFADNAAGDDLHPEPKAYIFAASRRWMDPNDDGDPSDGIDGWRLDVAIDVPDKFWKDWNREVREINPQCFTVAEAWGPAGEYLARTGFSSTMNYHGFAIPVKGFFVDQRISAISFAQRMTTASRSHTAVRRYALQNLVDSHDTPRLATMLTNAKHGDYRQPDLFDYDFHASQRSSPRYCIAKPSARDRQMQRMIALLQMTYVGPPMIYYGTEAGMWGGDDPCDRMPMLWKDKQFEPLTLDAHGRTQSPQPIAFDEPLFRFYASACQLRKSHAALESGNAQWLTTEDSPRILVLKRWNHEECLYVLFNGSDQPWTWQPPHGVEELKPVLATTGEPNDIKIDSQSDNTQVQVPAHHGVVLWERIVNP